MTCDCFGTIRDPDRAKLWDGLFPENKIPLKHPLIEGTAKTGNEEYQFYKVDLERITAEQLKEIHKRAALRFNITIEQAEESTRILGIPLKADGVSISWCEHHSRVLMMNAIDFGHDE